MVVAQTRTLRLTLAAGFALLLTAASILPLLQVVSWGSVYVAASTDSFYTPLAEQAGQTYHFFDRATLGILSRAVPYFALLLLLQSGAAFALSGPLSRSAFFKSHSFMWGLCLSGGMTVAVTTILWVRLSH